MFKKIIAVLLAVLMITGLVGCGGEKPKDETRATINPKQAIPLMRPLKPTNPNPPLTRMMSAKSLLSSIQRERLKKRFCLITKSQK